MNQTIKNEMDNCFAANYELFVFFDSALRIGIFSSEIIEQMKSKYGISNEIALKGLKSSCCI